MRACASVHARARSKAGAGEDANAIETRWLNCEHLFLENGQDSSDDAFDLSHTPLPLLFPPHVGSKLTFGSPPLLQNRFWFQIVKYVNKSLNMSKV